jgi:DNA-binding transcriptional ArsR family regulator
MTEYEKYSMIANGEVNDEIVEWARTKVERADALAEAKANEKKATDDLVVATLSDEWVMASEIADSLDLTTGKVSASLKRLAEANLVDVNRESKPYRYKAM